MNTNPNKLDGLERLLEDIRSKVDKLYQRVQPESGALTRAEAAAYLKCHPQTLYTWAVTEGRIPYHQVNDRGGLRFRKEDLDAFLERCRIREID